MARSRQPGAGRLISLLALLIAIPAVFVGAHALAQNSGIVRDSQRRQALQRQVDAWAERYARAAFERSVENVSDIGVRIVEPTTVLPADLGGPLPGSVQRIPVEISAQGYGYDSFGYRHDGFGHRGFARLMNCRIHQSLMMRVGRDGRPVSLVEGQRITTPVACATGY
ncbi:MAG: hypothetical protein KF767_14195 [Bdellovibrionaceae bacterium]|nr:hypothetical protein [Pseudobdellovibrionaceae bacterium]